MATNKGWELKTDRAKGEILTRVDRDVWVRLSMNDGCNLLQVGSEPKYDNQAKEILTCEEGILDLSLTENKWQDRKRKFVKASVNYRGRENAILIRVDNQWVGGAYHYNVVHNGIVIEDHTPITYDPSQTPLRFSMARVVNYFNTNFNSLERGWRSFLVPPLNLLASLLVFDSPLTNSVMSLPLSFVAYPGTAISGQVFCKSGDESKFVPKGILLRKR